MKSHNLVHVSTLFACIMVTSYANASDDPTGDIYHFETSVPLWNCTEADGFTVGDQYAFSSERGDEFQVLDRDDEWTLVQFLPWPNQSSTDYQRYYRPNEASDTYRFCIRNRHFEQRTVYFPPVWEFVGGPVAIPIKLRSKHWHSESSQYDDLPFDFDTDLNISGVFGFGLNVARPKPLQIQLFGFAGLSSVSVTEETAAEIEDETKYAAFSYGAGIGLQTNSVGVGLVLGFDAIASNGSTNWAYQNQPWIGVAIGKTFGKSISKSKN